MRIRTLCASAWAAALLVGAQRVESRAPSGKPVWVDLTPGSEPAPDGYLVRDARGVTISPKIDWRPPVARVSWLSTGASPYTLSPERSSAPPVSMVGVGDRVTYGRAGVRGKLAVGLWAHPAPIDFDRDGDIDLIVGCPDRPYNGTYLFRNIGSRSEPVYSRAERMGKGHKDLVAADFNGDGALDLVASGGYYSDVRTHRMEKWIPVRLDRDYHVGRDDLWHPVDWDRDGVIDLLAGVSDWRDYGWDDAFDSSGKWTRGPLHGYVYFHRNAGTNAAPRFEKGIPLTAGGRILDLYGSPAPNPVDWFGKGRLDLIGGDFVDSVTIFANNGHGLDAGRKLHAGGSELHMDVCMIQPRVADWHGDGRPSLIIGEEDGTVSLIENRAPKGREPDLAPPRHLVQVDPYLKSGVLSRPVAVDWNGDGRLDLVSGNSAGYIQWFENTAQGGAPVFEDRGYLTAGGRVIRRMAGANGSVQGPAEAKWGYSNPWVADWDGDGDLDLVVNDIWGIVVWYENIGTRTRPNLAPARDLEVEWSGKPPKPDWVWFEPRPKQLVTQWRTTPRVVDWDRDGLADLVMLNYQGYLCLYRRARRDGKLVLLPPDRIFLDAAGRFLNLAAGRAGRSGRRKIETVDWDGDGDLDLITDSDEGPVWYENIGSQDKPVMRDRGRVVPAKLPGHNPTPNAADWDGDGKLDLLIGAEDGFFYYYERSYIDSQK